MSDWRLNRVGLYTLIRREIVRFLRIWPQTLLPSLISTVLYLIIFGHLMGQRIGNIAGFQYVDFMIPGLVMMSVMTNAYTNVVSSFFLSKFQKTIEELLVSPLSNHTILNGFILGGVMRGLLISALLIVISIYFLETPIAHPWILGLACSLSAVLFSLAGFLNGLFAKTFDDINFVSTFILTPLIYLGGIFYSVQLLPQFWQKITYINPLFYLINTFRFGFLGYSEVCLKTVLSVVILAILGLYHLNICLLKKGIGIKS